MQAGLTVAYSTDLVALNIATTSPLRWAHESQPYVNGGTVFNFPVGWFANPPLVVATVELLNAVYTTDTLFSVFITQNTATQVTVRVNYKVGAGLTMEAVNNDVTVHLRAFDT